MTEFAPGPPEAFLVPGWLQRLAAVGWRLMATILVAGVPVAIAIMLATVTASILVAAIVAATFAPFVLTLRKRGWSRIKAAAAVFLGAAVVIIATLVVIAIAFIPYIADALEALSTGLAALKQEMAAISFPPEVAAAIERAAQDPQAWASANVAEIAASIGAVATVAIPATFLTFFFRGDRLPPPGI